MRVVEKINPLDIEGLSSDQNRLVESRLLRVLTEWEGTPHRAGQQVKGVGVDCVRFVTAVLDEMYDMQTPLARLPQDASFHSKGTCFSALRTFASNFPHEEIKDGQAQPGDILVTGPIGGGPGHAVVVGVKYLWHCDSRSVVRTGLNLTSGGVYFLKTTMRGLGRERWLLCGEN